MLSDACDNLKDTSNQPPMSFLRGYVGELGIYGRRNKEVVTYCDDLRKHRFLALPLPSAGMTCFLGPVHAHAGMT